MKKQSIESKLWSFQTVSVIFFSSRFIAERKLSHVKVLLNGKSLISTHLILVLKEIVKALRSSQCEEVFFTYGNDEGPLISINITSSIQYSKYSNEIQIRVRKTYHSLK